jgi:hypothetical protein
VVHDVGRRKRRPAAAALNPAYWPHLQSTQAQFAQVHFGLPQLRAALPQLQSTQVHGSQVHAGFSQVVAVLMIGSSLSPAHPMTISNAWPSLAPRQVGHPRLRADTVTFCAELLSR